MTIIQKKALLWVFYVTYVHWKHFVFPQVNLHFQSHVVGNLTSSLQQQDCQLLRLPVVTAPSWWEPLCPRSLCLPGWEEEAVQTSRPFASVWDNSARPSQLWSSERSAEDFITTTSYYKGSPLVNFLHTNLWLSVFLSKLNLRHLNSLGERKARKAASLSKIIISQWVGHV